ncbi:probable carboxylesterase 15 [Cynara cardunculus var. scolymus]|uniref:Alpha/beta hydrolase fold-3 n=1 Tax=Cynara cardunculus var. scolymus TaxID=59895 RepID=A0A103XH03_CYNCS|nr:probable carboxylesterase 15 [Cynara cardunculus var. scolymus]KVH90529.1 Alpha/beta hydrolase fold-3 [Cynara cardunculus var. scolymus]
MGSLPHVVEDCFGLVQIFSDGSIQRHERVDFPAFPVKDDGSVVWKDYCYDNLHDLHLRLYKPISTTAAAKLPVIFYLRGGGFCLGSFAWPHIHNCCLRLSSALHAIVVAPDYRLAPEHRLPAAMDDSLAALKWLQDLGRNPKGSGGDVWLDDVVNSFDFDRFFITGDSSGGNIAHHLAVQLGPGSPELAPVKIRGYVMLAPFFGGKERTKSEAEGSPERFLNVDILDMFWRMSLPVGDTTDHPYANPFGPQSPSLEPVKLDPILLIVGGDEIMKDRVKLYAERLKELRKKAQYFEFKGEQHGFFTYEPYSDVSDSVMNLIKDFMFEHSS